MLTPLRLLLTAVTLLVGLLAVTVLAIGTSMSEALRRR